MLVYGYWRVESRLGSLEEAMVANDVKIGSLLDKHIVEETIQREQLEEKVNFYEKEFNINPLSWGKKKRRWKIKRQIKHTIQIRCLKMPLIQNGSNGSLKEWWRSKWVVWLSIWAFVPIKAGFEDYPWELSSVPLLLTWSERKQSKLLIRKKMFGMVKSSVKRSKCANYAT